MDKTFDEDIALIRKAERGVEVREAIAEGMEYVKQHAEEVTGQQQAALQAAQTATGAAQTATGKAAAAAESESAANASASASKTSETNSKTSEKNSADYLQATKEYFEQVRTIAIGAQGWYATPEALKTAVPVGENGWWAVVGTTDTIWTWDGDTNSWKDSVQKADFSDYYTREQVDALLEAQKLTDHPVGSIYQSTDPTSPAALFGGTWQEIAQNRVLMGASSTHAAGTTVEAGLPNIVGSITQQDVNSYNQFLSETQVTLTGAFKTSGLYSCYGIPDYKSVSNSIPKDLLFDASKSNAIYGRSNTVQPAAYYVHIWHRVA